MCTGLALALVSKIGNEGTARYSNAKARRKPSPQPITGRDPMSRLIPILTTSVLLVLFATASWSQGGLLRGTVEDSDGSPISGAKVTVTSEQLSSFRKTLTTDKEGRFRLRFQKNQTQYRFDLLFERPGYASFTMSISPSATQEMRERFVMERSQTQAVQSRGDLASVLTGSSNPAIEDFNAGLTAQLAGDLDTARTRFEDALAADPELGPAFVALAQVFLDQGNYASAIQAANRALELNISRAAALQTKYQALRALGKNEDADLVGSELEKADDDAAAALRLYNEGGQAFQSDDRSTALAKFEQAAKLDPSLTEAHHAIATLQLADGNHEASAEAAERALALGSEDLRTLRVLYDAYDALGRAEALAEIAPRLAAVDPEFGGAKLLEQAALSWNAGEAEKAASLSRMALRIDPDLAKAYYFIGLDHLSKSENSEARAALQRFIDLAPDDPEAATAGEMLTYIQ